MKRIFIKYSILTLLVATVLLNACSNKPRSQKTGMVYNDKTNGGFQLFRKTHPAPGPGLVPIEGGTFVMGGSLDQDVQYDYQFNKRRVSISSFYMDETEVANRDWLDYVHWLAINFPTDRELYYNALPDTLVWRKPLSYNEPYVNNYFRHPSYQDYPVVGVTWTQAKAYCVWRTDRVNENILRETGRLADWKTASNDGKKVPSMKKGEPFNTDVYLNGQNKGNGIDGKNMMTNLSPTARVGANGRAVRPVIFEDGILKAAYRLPDEAEWEYAALGLVGNTQFENTSEGRMYPWNGMGVRSPKKQTRGMILANFKRASGDFMGVAGSLNDKADITAPVRSYLPNDFGLYNMAGNVNEWTADTYRELSYEEFEELNAFRGNEFVNKRLSDPAKGVLAKDKYGQPIYDQAPAAKKQTWAEVVASQNAAKTGTTTAPAADNNNPLSTTKPVLATDAVNKYATGIEGKPYKADQRGFNDTVSTVLYGHTTLVNDHSKVYKGGSWNDLAYWLNPATHRFMDQDDASAEVGFRCAMDMVGAAEVNPQGKTHFEVKKAKDFKPR